MSRVVAAAAACRSPCCCRSPLRRHPLRQAGGLLRQARPTGRGCQGGGQAVAVFLLLLLRRALREWWVVAAAAAAARCEAPGAALPPPGVASPPPCGCCPCSTGGALAPTYAAKASARCSVADPSKGRARGAEEEAAAAGARRQGGLLLLPVCALLRQGQRRTAAAAPRTCPSRTAERSSATCARQRGGRERRVVLGPPIAPQAGDPSHLRCQRRGAAAPEAPRGDGRGSRDVRRLRRPLQRRLPQRRRTGRGRGAGQRGRREPRRRRRWQRCWWQMRPVAVAYAGKGRGGGGVGKWPGTSFDSQVGCPLKAAAAAAAAAAQRAPPPGAARAATRTARGPLRAPRPQPARCAAAPLPALDPLRLASSCVCAGERRGQRACVERAGIARGGAAQPRAAHLLQRGDGAQGKGRGSAPPCNDLCRDVVDLPHGVDVAQTAGFRRQSAEERG